MPIVVVPCLGSRMWSLQSPNINPKNWSQWFSKRNLPQNRTLRLTWGRAIIIIIIIIIIIVIVIINITRYYTTPRCDSVCVSPLSHRVSLFWSLKLVTMYGSKREHHSASQTLSQAVHPVANTSSILTFWLRTGTTYVLYSLVVLNYYIIMLDCMSGMGESVWTQFRNAKRFSIGHSYAGTGCNYWLIKSKRSLNLLVYCKHWSIQFKESQWTSNTSNKSVWLRLGF